MSPSVNHAKVKPEPVDEPIDEDIGPTDLSMNQNSSSRLLSPACAKDATIDRFQFPQDLTVSQMNSQTSMDTRDTYSRHGENNNISNSAGSVTSHSQIKVEVDYS